MTKPHYVKKKGEWWKFLNREHYVNYLKFLFNGGPHQHAPFCVSNRRFCLNNRLTHEQLNELKSMGAL